jgi:hypothetical protein
MKYKFSHIILILMGFRVQQKYCYYKNETTHWFPVKISDDSFKYIGEGLIAEKLD